MATETIWTSCLGNVCEAFRGWTGRKKEQPALTLEMTLDVTGFEWKPLSNSTPIGGVVPDVNFFNFCSISTINSIGDPFDYSWGDHESPPCFGRVPVTLSDSSLKWEIWKGIVIEMIDDPIIADNHQHWFKDFPSQLESM